jgi:plastocyanin
MKLFMGFIILLVALVAITGCTQTAPTSAPTTTETTAPTTDVTTAATPVVTTEQTTVPNTTATIVANVTTPAANVTATAPAAPVVPTVTAASGITTIHITSAGFTPQTDVVLPGTGISWVNDDNSTHAVKMIGDNEGMFDSGDIITGSAFTYTFSEKTGTFTYALADNKTVTGTIIVKAGRSLSG